MNILVNVQANVMVTDAEVNITCARYIDFNIHQNRHKVIGYYSFIRMYPLHFQTEEKGYLMLG
jgi:hypothetical protein